MLGEAPLSPSLYRRVVGHVQGRELVRLSQGRARCAIMSVDRPQPTTMCPARGFPRPARAHPRVTPVIATTRTVAFAIRTPLQNSPLGSSNTQAP